MREPLVYIVVLNYKGCNDTIECIESLKKLTYSKYKILIVDNDSKDDSVKRLSESYPEIQVVDTHYNYGYAEGNNVGIRIALEQKADYICVLNNDTVMDPECITHLVDFMEQNPKVAFTGPNVYDYYQKDVILSSGAFMNMKTGEGGFLLQEDCESKTPVMCDYIPGCCIMVRAKELPKIGLIPTPYFMFYEETEWCIKARKQGYLSAGCVNAKIWHKESAAMQGNSEFKKHFLMYNRILFEKRNASATEYFVFCIYYLFQWFFRRVTARKEQNSLRMFMLVQRGKETEKYKNYYRG